MADLKSRVWAYVQLLSEWRRLWWVFSQLFLPFVFPQQPDPKLLLYHLEAGQLHGQAEPRLRESRLQGLLVHGRSTEPEIPSSSWGTEDTIDMEWRERNNCLGSLPLNSNMGSQVLQKGGSSCNRWRTCWFLSKGIVDVVSLQGFKR